MKQTLEEMFPDMENILQKQESSMENMLLILTNQVTLLHQENSLKSQRLNTFTKELQNIHKTIADLQDTIEHFRQENQNYQQEIEQLKSSEFNVNAEQVNELVTQQVVQMTSKLSSSMLASTQEAIGQAAQAQQNELKSSLELFDKKFDFFLRVKMEVKEIEKKIEKNEQSIGDIKLGLELLAKSVGTNEVEPSDEESDSNSSSSDQEQDIEQEEREGENQEDFVVVDSAEGNEVKTSPQGTGGRSISTTAPRKPSRNRSRTTLGMKPSVVVRPTGAGASPASTKATVKTLEEPIASRPTSVSTAEDIEGSTTTTAAEEEQVASATTPSKPRRVPSRPPQRSLVAKDKTSESVAQSNDEAVSIESANAEESLSPQESEIQSRAKTPDGAKESPVAHEKPHAPESSVGAEPFQPQEGEVTTAELSVAELEVEQKQELEFHEPTTEHEHEAATTAMLKSQSAKKLHRYQTEKTTPSSHGFHGGSLQVGVSASASNPEEEETTTAEEDPKRKSVDTALPLKKRQVEKKKFQKERRSPQPHSTNTIQEEEEEEEEEEGHQSSSSDSSENEKEENPKPQTPTARVRTPSSYQMSSSSLFMDENNRSDTPKSIARRSRRPSCMPTKGCRSTPLNSSTSDTLIVRPPMTKDQIRKEWQKVFYRLIQIRRLQGDNIASNEKSLFRGTQISVGARVKRMEEAAMNFDNALTVVEKQMDTLWSDIHTQQSNADTQLLRLGERVHGLEESQLAQDQVIHQTETKVDALNEEVRRLRHVKNESHVAAKAEQAATTTMVQQHRELLERLQEKMTMTVDQTEQIVKKLQQEDFPALSHKLETSLQDLKYSFEQKAKSLHENTNKLQITQQKALMDVKEWIRQRFEKTYGDLSTLTCCLLLGVDVPDSSTEMDTTSKKKKQQPVVPIFKLALEQCRMIVRICINELKPWKEMDTTCHLSLLLDKMLVFQNEMDKLENISNAQDQLILLTNSQVDFIESFVKTYDTSQLTDETQDTLLFLQEICGRFKAVFLLVQIRTQLENPRCLLTQLLLSTNQMQEQMDKFSVSFPQVDNLQNMVQKLHTKVDTVVDLSFGFAKEKDVKKTMEEVLTSSQLLKESLSHQVEQSTSETLQRANQLDQELSTLMSKINKKLDKDELLYTQEVLERQLTNVASNALDQQDFIEFQKILRTKMDKKDLQNVLLQQKAQLLEFNNGSSNNNSSNSFTNTSHGTMPLVSATSPLTKCVSCHGDVPPTKSELQRIIRQELQYELTKAFGSSSSSSSSSSSGLVGPGRGRGVSTYQGFQASTHKSMEKFKLDLLQKATVNKEK